VPNFGTTDVNSFQVWIGINGTQEITFVFDTLTSGSEGLATVGAENRFGNRGSNFYVNGTGTLPDSSTQLAVTSAPGSPGETKVITYQARGLLKKPFQNCAELTSSVFQGVNLACVNGQVN
jgi:hypothetical protein